MTLLYIEWNDPIKKVWHTVGRLQRVSESYAFQYTKGALASKKFTPFGMMKDLDTAYWSNELFPLFANRLLNKSRPEFDLFLSWLNLSEGSDPLSVLSVSQGVRGTDSLRVFSLPQKAVNEPKYESNFFISGISHLASEVLERLKRLEVGDKLLLMDDIQNDYPEALAVRTQEPKALVGYCPSYLSKHLKSLLVQHKAYIEISVAKLNMDAPAPYKLLSKLSIHGVEGESVFDAEEYEPLSDL